MDGVDAPLSPKLCACATIEQKRIMKIFDTCALRAIVQIQSCPLSIFHQKTCAFSFSLCLVYWFSFIWLFCECYVCAWAVAVAAADVVVIVIFGNRYCLSHRIMFTFICVVLSFCFTPFILVPYLCLEIETWFHHSSSSSLSLIFI